MANSLVEIERHSLAHCNGFIYAIGGGDDLKSAGKYDVGKKEWSLVSEMNEGRRSILVAPFSMGKYMWLVVI